MEQPPLDPAAASILVVDDQLINTRFLSRVLRQRGYTVQAVNSGIIALNTVQRNPPDVILLDISMPDMDGYEVCRRLKLLPDAIRDIPVIFISVYDETEDKVKAFAVGGVDYITKPFQVNEVLARVATHLALRQMHQRLQEQNAKLQQEIAERRRAEETLRKFQAAVEHSPSAVMITSTDGMVEHVNPRFSQITGYTAAEMVGKNPNLLQAGALSPDVYAEMWQAMRAGHEWRGEVRNQRKNGEYYWELASIAPIFDDQGDITHFVAVKEDITKRKQMEDELRRAHDDLERRVVERTQELTHANAALQEMIREARSMERILQHNLQFVETLLTTIPSPVFYKDTHGRYLGCNHRFAEQILGLPPEAIKGLTFSDLAGRIPTEMAEIYQAHDEELLREPGVHVYEAAVVCADKVTHNFLFRKTTFTNPDGSIAGIVGVMWDITERVQHERQRVAIITVTTALRTATNRTELIQTLLEQVVRLLKADGALLVTSDPDRDEVFIEHGHGRWAEYSGRHVPAVGGRKTGPHGSSPNALANTGIHLLDTVKSLACIPLISQEETIGTLGVGFQHAINNEEMSLLNAIADMAANALQRVTLHEQTERRLQHVQALHTIDQAITSSLDLRLTLDVVLDQVTAQLHVDAATILLFDTEKNCLSYAAGTGFPTTLIEEHTVNLGEGTTGRAAQQQVYVYVPDMQQADDCSPRFEALRSAGFSSYYGVPLVARRQICGVLELFQRAPVVRDQEWHNFMITLAGQASIAIDSADMFAQLQRANAELTNAYDATIEGWARALELRDKETEGHCRRVTELTVRLARMMGCTEDEIVHIRRGAILHDIGKMAIPDSILLKEGPLTSEEFAIMQQHPTHAYELLQTIPFLHIALDIPYAHHEKWNGKGYPRGLKDEEIPLAARIFAVVDVWDALVSDRPYRKGWQPARIFAHIREQSGQHFDPAVVEAFLRMMGVN